MASIFTYQEEPPRIHSPWSTPGSNTPQTSEQNDVPRQMSSYQNGGVTKLEPERQEGPTEYKLHLLLRPRRKFSTTSTLNPLSGSQHSKPSLSSNSARSLSETLVQRPSSLPSSQTRQARLQQLTTQLLWRLQQSSPFHSSSNAQLVVPVLPEATPRLGVPERPAKLLPGLEESQGALYEIGVADDGSLVGLVDDEMEESLTNLRAMAASLGCVIDVLRRVGVGSCEWVETNHTDGVGKAHLDQLWVAEVLVRPDTRALSDVSRAPLHLSTTSKEKVINTDLLVNRESCTDQMRVAIVGASHSGKSSLLGTLSTSTLDNGRGKSRLSLLKHRHEIASGVTSSVAQELIGYVSQTDTESNVINYASGNVSSWIDIHNLADRLVFLSDSPGLPRFAKSTFRALISWDPRWTVCCVAADDHGESYFKSERVVNLPDSLRNAATSNSTDLSLAHLRLCLKFSLPVMVVITKLDVATKSGLRLVLTQTLSALKSAGRKPVLLTSANAPQLAFALDSADSAPDVQNISDMEQAEVERVASSVEHDSNIVPIVMTSALSGNGIGMLHAFLRSLPCSRVQQVSANQGLIVTEDHNRLLGPVFNIDEVFSIPPSRVYSSELGCEASDRGVVLCGHISRGTISVGDQLCIGPLVVDDGGVDQSPVNMIRSKSFSAQNTQHSERRLLSGHLAKSFGTETPMNHNSESKSTVFLSVSIVSLRNLRLPVRTMHEGETGTIGIEALSSSNSIVPLHRARKGMVLTQHHDDLTGYRSFSASFPSIDFHDAASPPLVLGGHAIIYANSIRAAVKVTAVALAESDVLEPSSPAEFFNFDSDQEPNDLLEEKNELETEIKITFRFSSTVEWMETGDKILVVPTTVASGPVSGPPVATTGLSGFVGRINELFA